jgi:hypothetical protein|tara:strand:- start:707 stop:904 length:198 start_codon:yes stop_codon:yes gene_type:complete
MDPGTMMMMAQALRGMQESTKQVEGRSPRQRNMLSPMQDSFISSNPTTRTDKTSLGKNLLDTPVL